VLHELIAGPADAPLVRLVVHLDADERLAGDGGFQDAEEMMLERRFWMEVRPAGQSARRFFLIEMIAGWAMIGRGQT
jgi:hypothetical protein